MNTIFLHNNLFMVKCMVFMNEIGMERGSCCKSSGVFIMNRKTYLRGSLQCIELVARISRHIWMPRISL
jgi:hypothetical protein